MEKKKTLPPNHLYPLIGLFSGALLSALLIQPLRLLPTGFWNGYHSQNPELH